MRPGPTTTASPLPLRQAPWWGPLLHRVLLAGLCLGLAACGALRVLYGQGEHLSYWWLDRYVDFNGLQSPTVRRGLEDWFAWQRAEALPPVLKVLDTLRSEAARTEISPERLCGWWRDALALRDEAVRAIVPAAAEVALTLTPAQIAHIEARQAKSNEEYRDDFLQDDPQDRLDASVDRAVDRLKMLYGSLSAPQRAQVQRWIQASPFDAERWGRERQRRQTELLATLHELQARKPPLPEAEAALGRWWDTAVNPRAPDYQAYVRQLETDNCRFLASFHRDTSERQRRHLVERLEGWSADLRAFALAP